MKKTGVLMRKTGMFEENWGFISEEDWGVFSEENWGV